jgi:thiamine-monophosphate kinase
LLALALPESHAGAWLEGFLAGVRRASRRFQCAAAGGDTTRSEKILINVTVVGETKKGFALLRAGAKPGDGIFVSGRLGEAELGLQELLGKPNATRPMSRRLRKHLYPEPRLGLGRWLADSGMATAAMDLSDGLSSDLPRLCAASGLGAVIEEACLPLAVLPRKVKTQISELRQAGLNGGDDYELLFTVPKKKESQLPRKVGGLAITRIGTITMRREMTLVREGGGTEKLRPRGWDPFRNT